MLWTAARRCLAPGRLAGLGGVLLLLALPRFLSGPLATEFLTWALFGLAFNLLLGYTGLLSFGHALFFGMGAYAVGLSTLHLRLPLVAGLALALVASGAAALVVGALSIRRIGIYFAMLTLASAQVFYFLAISWTDFTGGDNGLSIRRPSLALPGVVAWRLDSATAFYYFALVVFLLAAAFLWRLADSPFGRVLQGIRENELRMRSLGLNVERFKLLALVISGAGSGLAGALNALHVGYVHPNVAHWSVSGEVIIIALIGGSRSFAGPIVGAAVFVVLSDYLSRFWDRWMLALGVLFVLVTLYLRDGLVGALNARGAAWFRWTGRGQSAPAVESGRAVETLRR